MLIWLLGFAHAAEIAVAWHLDLAGQTVILTDETGTATPPLTVTTVAHEVDMAQGVHRLSLTLDDGASWLALTAPCDVVSAEGQLWARVLGAKFIASTSECPVHEPTPPTLTHLEVDGPDVMAQHLDGYVVELTRCHRDASARNAPVDNQARAKLIYRGRTLRKLKLKDGTGDAVTDACLTELLGYSRSPEDRRLRVDLTLSFPGSYQWN